MERSGPNTTNVKGRGADTAFGDVSRGDGRNKTVIQILGYGG